MKRIPPFKLIAEPLDEEGRRMPGFRWAGEDIGKRHRIGGDPETPVSDRDWPRCPDCGSKMTFYGQLDSLNDEFCIADAGMIHVWICFECNQVKAEIAST